MHAQRTWRHFWSESKNTHTFNIMKDWSWISTCLWYTIATPTSSRRWLRDWKTATVSGRSNTESKTAVWKGFLHRAPIHQRSHRSGFEVCVCLEDHAALTLHPASLSQQESGHPNTSAEGVGWESPLHHWGEISTSGTCSSVLRGMGPLEKRKKTRVGWTLEKGLSASTFGSLCLSNYSLLDIIHGGAMINYERTSCESNNPQSGSK